MILTKNTTLLLTQNASTVLTNQISLATLKCYSSTITFSKWTKAYCNSIIVGMDPSPLATKMSRYD